MSHRDDLLDIVASGQMLDAGQLAQLRAAACDELVDAVTSGQMLDAEQLAQLRSAAADSPPRRANPTSTNKPPTDQETADRLSGLLRAERAEHALTRSRHQIVVDDAATRRALSRFQSLVVPLVRVRAAASSRGDGAAEPAPPPTHATALVAANVQYLELLHARETRAVNAPPEERLRLHSDGLAVARSHLALASSPALASQPDARRTCLKRALSCAPPAPLGSPVEVEALFGLGSLKLEASKPRDALKLLRRAACAAAAANSAVSNHHALRATEARVHLSAPSQRKPITALADLAHGRWLALALSQTRASLCSSSASTRVPSTRRARPWPSSKRSRPPRTRKP